jgi:hypothetical protein
MVTLEHVPVSVNRLLQTLVVTRGLDPIGAKIRDAHQSSWPDLIRPSIFFARRSLTKLMDCRVKPGNDGGSCRSSMDQTSQQQLSDARLAFFY